MSVFNGDFTYHEFSKAVKNNAKILTIWNKVLLGGIKRVYDADLPDIGGDPGTIGGVTLGSGQGVDGGRPISIIITEKDYILMNKI